MFSECFYWLNNFSEKKRSKSEATNPNDINHKQLDRFSQNSILSTFTARFARNFNFWYNNNNDDGFMEITKVSRVSFQTLTNYTIFILFN